MNTPPTDPLQADEPTPGALAELARDVLLDHLTRGDARHALRLMVHTLAKMCGGHAAVQAETEDGRALWLEGHREATTSNALPVHCIGHPVGRLWLVDGQGREHERRFVEPLWPTLGALLQAAAQAPQALPGSEPARLHSEVVRAALRGADTFVWEWTLDNDWLSDVDEGLRMLGYAPGEVGHTQDDWNGLIHPDDRAANHAAYLQHACGEVPAYEHRYRVRSASGDWRWTHERGRIVEWDGDGRPRRMVGTQTDITDSLRREAAAQQATSRLTSIASSVPWVLFQYLQASGAGAGAGVGAGTAPGDPPEGPQGTHVDRFLYVSPRSIDVLGLPSERLMTDARVLSELILPQDQALRRGLGQVAAGSAAVTEFRIRRPDGAVRWLRITSTHQGPALRQHGPPDTRATEHGVLWHGSMEDVTEQRELARAQEAAAAAQAANDAKTRFLAHMSHELRTPLNAVLGFTQLLELDKTDPASDSQRRRLRLIRDAGEHLLRMITDLLDLTRIEAGQLSLRLEPVPLRSLAEQALHMVQAQADAAQVLLSLDPGAPLWMQGDRTRVHQVLLNLLVNAIKYNRPGGRVVLRLQRGTPAQVQITVTDTGLGIAEADVAQVFEPFYRGPQAGGKVEGAGIGLAVTRALVQLMGGTIEVQSTPGAGSSFSVLWPQLPAPEPTVAAASQDDELLP